MALARTRIGVHPVTGGPWWHYAAEPGGFVVITGPAEGPVTLSDGTTYDVSPGAIQVASIEHAGEVAHHCGVQVEEVGHPSHDGGDPYFHHCSPLCAAGIRDLSDPYAAAAAVQAQAQTSAILDAALRAHHADALGTGAGDDLSASLASAAAENAALNGLSGTGNTNVIPDVSLHTATPSTTGASENANSGSYARQACSWNAASGGNMTNSSSLTFSTGGSTAVTHFGTWSSATYGAGTYALGGALAASVTSTSITIAAAALTISAS